MHVKVIMSSIYLKLFCGSSLSSYVVDGKTFDYVCKSLDEG